MNDQFISGRREYVTLKAEANAASPAHLLRDNYQNMTASIHPGDGGTARLEITMSAPAAVVANTADWIDVSFGGTTLVTQDEGVELPAAITAVRVVAQTVPGTANIVSQLGAD